MGCGNELVRGQGEWRWHAGWGVLTRVGAVLSQILCGDHRFCVAINIVNSKYNVFTIVVCNYL